MRAIFMLFFWCLNSAFAAPPCQDEGKVYKVCSDQAELFQAAMKGAAAAHKNLVVVIGAEWCPWCLSLHGLLKSPKALPRKISPEFDLVSVALFEGKKKIAGGEAVRDELQKLSKEKGKLEGIPLLALVNPTSRRAAWIETEPLEKNTATSKGHDPEKVAAALEKASAALK